LATADTSFAWDCGRADWRTFRVDRLARPASAGILDWLALRIAMLGVDFEVHEPPELVEHLCALAAGRPGDRCARGSSCSAQVGSIHAR